MFTVNIQSTTKSGITLSMSFAAKDEKELKSKTEESVQLVHKPTTTHEPKQMELGESLTMTALKVIKDLNATKSEAELSPQAEKLRSYNPAPKESSIDGTKVSDLDKDGRVWNEHIDSPMKTKDRWGRWKARIGVDKTTRIRTIEEMKLTPESQTLPTNTQEAVTQPEIEQETLATNVVEHMTLEHFTNNFPTVMGNLFTDKKITAEKVQQLCEIARVKQAYEIPANEWSLKAVYNTMVSENII